MEGSYSPLVRSFGQEAQARFSGTGSQKPMVKQQQQQQQQVTQVDRLRKWRDDALVQHQYVTAEHIGDKIHAMTKDADDLFALAQVYFAAGDYGRAHHVLVSSSAGMNSLSCRYLATFALIKAAQWESALELIESAVSEGESSKERTSETRNSSRHPRTRMEPALNTRTTSENQLINGINLEASMLFLKGQIYTNTNSFDRAKQCYMDALRIDAKCYEAFDQLVRNHLITPKEEWQLLKSLDFESSCADNAELVKSLYTIRLGKYINIPEYQEAVSFLEEDYRLQDNNDILLSKADLLYTQCKFKECLQLCEKMLNEDRYMLTVMPNYLSCLHELRGRNKLFLLAHKLANDHPDEPVTWLAVGIYYLTIDKIIDARRYFSKASMMHPYFGQAWIGFAHTFAIEGEHEQAISAYSTAARLFQGTHLPTLFLGMQHLLLNNLTLAEEYLSSSFKLCQTDPLLLNELGVVAYHKNDLATAEVQFHEALKAASDLDSDLNSWLSIQANLAHVYRRLEQFDKAKYYFENVLRSSPQDANIHSSIGLVNLQTGKTQEALINFHNALSIAPNDSVATDLLKRALEKHSENSATVLLMSEDEDIVDFGDPEIADIIVHEKGKQHRAQMKTPTMGTGMSFSSSPKSSNRVFRHTPSSPEQFYNTRDEDGQGQSQMELE